MIRPMSWDDGDELDAIVAQLDLVALQDESFTPMWMLLKRLFMLGYSHDTVWCMAPQMLGISDHAFRKRVSRFRRWIVPAFWQSYDDVAAGED